MKPTGDSAAGKVAATEELSLDESVLTDQPAAAGPPGTRTERAVGIIGRLVLLGLLGVLLWGAITFDARSRAPVGDEATYTLQALSLGHDLDLVFEAGDHRRFTDLYSRPPDRLALQSRDGGGTIAFGAPFWWSLWAAPFLRLGPLNGAAVANVLLLALAAWAAARALARRIGPAAWWWVAALGFASVSFAYAFLATPDLSLLACTAIGLALTAGAGAPARPASEAPPQIYGEPDDDEGGRPRSVLRWLAAGALLAIPAVYRPVYATLLAAAAVATPRPRRGARIAALATGALVVVLFSAGGQWLAGGGWNPWQGRRAFAAGGYPGVDFPAEVWPGPGAVAVGAAEVAPGATAPPLDARLWGWNLLYLVAGRDVGLVPYFLPGLLLIGLAAGGRGRGGRWALAAAVVLSLGALLWLRPFNFFGGSEAIANRFFLPLYPALWFLAARGGGSLVRRTLGAVASAALAAPFLLPLWSAPRAHPVADDGRYRYVAPIARELLPFETTQTAIPAPRAIAGGLTLAFVAGDAGPGPGDRGRLRLRGGREVELLVASPEPLERLGFSFGRRAPSQLEVLAGGALGDTLLRDDGGISFAIDLEPSRTVHPTPWSAGRWSFYRLRFRLVEAPPFDLPFTVRAGGW